jgi:hypothetical protein
MKQRRPETKMTTQKPQPLHPGDEPEPRRRAINGHWVEYSYLAEDGAVIRRVAFPRFQLISDAVIAELDQWDSDNPPRPIRTVRDTKGLGGATRPAGI